MSGLIGKKIGMTSMYVDGKQTPCTLIETGPCVVTQVRTPEKDGYKAVQLGFGDKKEKNTSAALLGHFKKAKTSPKYKLVEFNEFTEDFNNGDTIQVNDVFEEDQYVEVIGKSKGKGFQGVVKRHGFHGVGGQTHGQHNRQRHPGAIGACSYPSRVFKGLRMAGRTGNRRVKVFNLRVLKVLPEKNLMVVSGSVPGANNSYVIVER